MPPLPNLVTAFKHLRVFSVDSIENGHVRIDKVEIEHPSRKEFNTSIQLKPLNEAKRLSHPKLQSNEIDFLEETIKSDYKDASIRLREGEYQYGLAKAIASFHLELYFPDVKDIIRRLYEEEKANDLQFVRKVQTVLKKMEKSNIVRILPKNKPWELQRYALSSFKFRDSDKNPVNFATDEQIKEMQSLLRSMVNKQETANTKHARPAILITFTIASYVAVLWTLLRPIIDPVVFVLALGISVVLSLLLGEALSQGLSRDVLP
jgi:hypothetical protein